MFFGSYELLEAVNIRSYFSFGTALKEKLCPFTVSTELCIIVYLILTLEIASVPLYFERPKPMPKLPDPGDMRKEPDTYLPEGLYGRFTVFDPAENVTLPAASVVYVNE